MHMYVMCYALLLDLVYCACVLCIDCCVWCSGEVHVVIKVRFQCPHKLSGPSDQCVTASFEYVV